MSEYTYYTQTTKISITALVNHDEMTSLRGAMYSTEPVSLPGANGKYTIVELMITEAYSDGKFLVTFTGISRKSKKESA